MFDDKEYKVEKHDHCVYSVNVNGHNIYVSVTPPESEDENNFETLLKHEFKNCIFRKVYGEDVSDTILRFSKNVNCIDDLDNLDEPSKSYIKNFHDLHKG